MSVLVTGSAGHLGEALMRTFAAEGNVAIGVDLKASAYTHYVGSITDRAFVERCMRGVTVVLHTATLHKPHVATHSRQDFIDINITGTLNLLETAAVAGVKAFVYTSTTSTFGDAMQAEPGSPAVWVTEDLQPIHKNIYGVTKIAAEGLCELFSRRQKLPCIVLRTSRFFPEEDDNRGQREAFVDDNLKVNELLFRRADIHDVVSAHKLAIDNASALGFDRFIISATPPFEPADRAALGVDAPAVIEKYLPHYIGEYARRGWRMFPSIGRVYDNARALEKLGWVPKYTFDHAIACLIADQDYRSPLAREIGCKGYHEILFEDGPYPVEG